ncbi:MAG: hypothetical protein A2X19_01450 [Bacteroidetes bacterium GWE2_39_28]|nr:MAG: hypothetical protein A2X19_01450 [Bacteroidetes bacterium GWE2_39_28]OFY15792.1 MAG: hypothetical protein A2X16_01720 [Bacteroidetes bacterium GWF2_39_10]OFZ06877.1 MAG: hypothetical protein A2322_01510 [Bacteroidetes bacterium RIFOXYB2_FULL_39_7]OFZ09960.1 MAG: hypothetical protein A2465_06660 [Bacteroidetes bacterium RIFOXYC2_FULL_39_11]HCT93502.1 hypothetical protein [Rikenellaceae bacterium]
MFLKPFFNFRIFIWVLLILAIMMGGVFLVIAYSYNLQKETERYIEWSRSSVSEAKEMENELTAIKGLTFTLLVNKSGIWIDSLNNRQTKFIYHLERARVRANTPEESQLISQVSALFSNHEQNIIKAVSFFKAGELSKANALLVHSAQELLVTIQQKSNEFITINQSVQALHERELSRTNEIILRILISLGIGGIVTGLLLSWLISRLLFGPLNQLILTIRSVSGDEVFEQLQLYHGGELDELDKRIKVLIEKINRANSDLSKNKELLQYSNKYATLGKIAPTIAHEIRNPLAAIKMLVYSIREGKEVSPSIKEDLDIITSEIDRMENFTKDFLKFAKPADPVFTRVNPTDSLSEVIHLLKPRIEKNNITLLNNTHKNKSFVMADSGHLKQVYMNIILNAVEVMPDGGTLTISYENVVLDEGEYKREYIRIDFDDSGNGIPDAIMKSLFEPFIRGSDMGVGLGLSISQGIANSHGGIINAENKSESKGAIFHFYLPLIN